MNSGAPEGLAVPVENMTIFNGESNLAYRQWRFRVRKFLFYHDIRLIWMIINWRKKYHTVRIVPKSNNKILDRDKSIPVTHKYTIAHFPGLATNTSIKSGGVKLQWRLSYVTFQGNTEIWSRKTGGRKIQVYLIWNGLCKEIRIKGQAFPLYEMMESCKCIPQMRNNWLRYQYKEVILCFILY